MASEKKSLPKITTKNYWGIRKKLKATMPRTITKSFVAAAMGIQENSAQMNVIGPMTQMGLIDENGAPTSLANEWRTDSTYPSACKKIREDVYPNELLDLAPDTDTDKVTIKNWIASHLMVGDEAARQAATVYSLLLEADPSEESAANSSSKKTNNETKPKPAAKPKKERKPKEKESEQEKGSMRAKFDQNMNINIQIHISADTNADQIDRIFSSMAKHLKSINE